LLLVDREAWTLELHRLREDGLRLSGQSRPDDEMALDSQVLPLRFQLVSGSNRPQIRVTHVGDGRTWMV
jgi:hypothetical protein